MEVKINLAYNQVLEIIRQFPTHQIAKLLIDAQNIMQQEKVKKDNTEFRAFLLSAPTMSSNEYEKFLENRNTFNQWRTK